MDNLSDDELEYIADCLIEIDGDEYAHYLALKIMDMISRSQDKEGN